jgi:leader peptidase (prepilin peptidase)/N-methyltransferase
MLWSATGAATGYFLLGGVVEFGKMAFGRRKLRPDAAILFEITGTREEPEILLGEERLPLAEFFYRESDRIEAEAISLEIDGERLGAGRITVCHSFLRHGEREWPLAALGDMMPVRASVTEIILPREAMGFGDVKFLACIGAFLGWKGVIFSLFAGSLAGAVIGMISMALTRGCSGGRIPFGPYLALGALLWVMAGPELLDFYFSHLRR